MVRSHLNIALGFVTIVMTLASWTLVIQGAYDEPYGYFRHSDAFAQIVVGTALISFWFCLSLAIVALVIAAQISGLWLTALLWAAICMFYLKDCPLGYLWDLEHIIVPYAGGVTGQ
jgi:hypothetical protein